MSKAPAGPPLPDPSLYGLPFTVDDFRGMPYRRLGSAGLRVSAVGLGAWKLGLPETGDGARVGSDAAQEILDAAFDEGVTFWDTANRYNNSSGNSERVIGRWFAAHPELRRSVELATKVYGTMDGRTPNFCRLSRAAVLESVYACLDRLRTDHIDLLQFHGFDDTTPVEESLAAVDDLVRQDLVRYFGLSNVTVAQMDAYRKVEAAFPRARTRSAQNQFDILHGEAPGRPGVLAYCARNEISFISWSPLRGGLLSERYLGTAAAKPGDRLVDEGRLSSELTPAVVAKLQALARIAAGAGWTIPQLVGAYMLRMPGMGPLIAGCSTPAQVRENAKAGRLRMEDAMAGEVQAALAA